MPFGLSFGELAIGLVLLAMVLGLVAWIGWIVVETARQFVSGLRGGNSERPGV